MRIADLCCGAGGTAMGLHQAFPNAEIVGVDIRPQPRFPFTFLQGDALEFDLTGFDFVWASPPCQEYTPLHARHPHKRYPDLIAAMRWRLGMSSLPYIIENVPGAPLIKPVVLCGAMFGLRTYRHRWFESSFRLESPPHSAHVKKTATTARRVAWDRGDFVSITGDVGTYLGSEAMGIDWMNGNELSQAVPPAYSRYLAQFIPLPVEKVA